MSHRVQNNGIALVFLVLLTPQAAAAQTVTASAARGFHPAPFHLKLTAPAGTVIHYTTDGSVPTHSSRVYPDSLLIAPIDSLHLAYIPTNHNVREDERWRAPRGRVNRGMVVRARAWTGSGWGPTATFSYFIEPEGAARYDALPVVSIVTEPRHFFAPDSGIYVPGRCLTQNVACNYFHYDGAIGERPVHIEFFETDGRAAFSQNAGLRLHGNTTVSRPIKSLRLYGRAVEGSPNRFTHAIFPDKQVTEYRRFLLRNSGNDWDQSLLRDGFQQTLIHAFHPGTQRYRPAIVFLNGEYWGIHNLRDRYDDHYLGTNFGVNRTNIVILENNALLDEGLAGDEAHYQQLIHLVSQQDPADPAVWLQITERMDVQDFTDFVLAHIHFRNTDWPGNNTRYWRVKRPYDPAASNRFDDGRWRWLVFDSDFGYDLQFEYVPGVNEGWNHNTLAFATAVNGPSWPNPPWSTLLLRRLLLNPDFKRAFITRYAILLETRFSPERTTHVLDSLAGRIRPHVPEHIERWGGNESMTEWEGHIERMRTFAQNRAGAQRVHLLAVFPEYTHYATLDVGVVGQGRIEVGREAITDARPLRFPVNHAVDLTAVPAPGQIFVRWIGVPAQLSGSPTLRYQPLGSAVIRAEFGVDTSVDSGPDSAGRPALLDAYPNPFNPSTVIGFRIADTGGARLDVFDVMGRLVARLVDSRLPAGEHSVTFDGAGLPSGVYIVRLTADGKTLTRRISLVK